MKTTRSAVQAAATCPIACRKPERGHARQPEAGRSPGSMALSPIIGLAALALLAAGTSHVSAQTTWNGSVDNDWHNEDNWNNGLPDVGKIAVIQNAGAVVNLTQNVTMSGGSFNVRVYETNGPLATLNISADLDLGIAPSTGVFEVGSRQNGQPVGNYYQAIVNQMAGEVTT